MNTSSAVRPLSKFAKAPLSVGLALVLGGSLSWSPSTTALEPFDGVANAPEIRTGLRLGDQRAALNRQLLTRGSLTPVAPKRPAGDVTVSNCDDSGTGSLRDAFLNAVSGDVIDLTSLDCSTITLSTGLTTSVDDLTINGPGAGHLAIDGDNSSRVIAHLGYGTLTIDGIAIRNGSYAYSSAGTPGGVAAGACLLSKKDMTISNSIVDHCSASGSSVIGGAIDVLGILHMTDSIVSRTTSTAEPRTLSATLYGGAIYAAAAYVTGSIITDVVVSASSPSFSGMMGGGIQGFFAVVLDHSRVSGVTTHVSSGAFAYARGGGVAALKTVVLTNSTVSGNSLHGTSSVGDSQPSIVAGGGIYLRSFRGDTYPSFITNSTIGGNSAIIDGDLSQYTIGGGGGLSSTSPVPVTVTNSTISGNTASTQGGGLYTRLAGSLVLANSTVTDNSAPDGAGIADNGTSAYYYDLITNSSIVAGNHLPGGAPLAEIISVHSITGANNLIGSANVALPGDTLGGDPLLGPLADNGGPTLTHALLPGSPATDAGSNLAGLASDQRGGDYLRVYGAAADIGAFESQPLLPDPIFANGFD